MKFDTDCSSWKVFFSRYFYKDLKSSIELGIDGEGQEQFAWDNLVQKSTKAKAKAKI